MIARFLILLTLLASMISLAVAAEPDINICKGRFRINAYLETAAALEAMTKDQAIALLQKWVQGSKGSAGEELSENSDWEVIILARMLFTENPQLKGKFTADGVYTGEVELSHPLLRPRIGGPLGFMGDDEPFGIAMFAKTLDPIVLIDNIPLLVATGGYFSSGPRPETAAEYLNYCIGNGLWGKIPYQKATKVQMEEAIRKYQKDFATRPLNKEEIESLRDQMTEPQNHS